MFSWNDFINDFPYTNFSDINVSWFLNKFKQIFDEWEGLYTSLQNWKTATDEYNENWRDEQEQAFTTWENNFQSAIDEWKTQTETDIGTWENDSLANLETWKNTFITQYNTLKAEVEQIAEDAETAKNSAQASAQSAQQSATSAQASAESIAQQSAQIETNTNDINDIKEILNGKPTHLTLELGAVRASDGVKYDNISRMRTVSPIYLETGDVFSVDHTIKFNCFRCDEDGVYIETIQGGFNYADLTINTDGYYMFCLELSADTSADLTGRESEFESYTNIEYANPDEGIVERLETIEERTDENSTNIANLNNIVNNIKDVLGEEKPTHLTIELGAVRASDGLKYDSVSRMRSIAPIYLETGDVFSVDHTIKFNCFRCDEDGVYIETIQGSFNYADLTINTDGYYMFCLELSADTSADLTGKESEFESYTNIEYANPDTGVLAQVNKNSEDIESLKTPIFKNQLQFNGIMNAGTLYSFGKRYCTDDYILSFNLHFSSFTSFKIGEITSDLTALSSAYIEIDDTNLTLVSATGTTWDRQEAHGLTIANDLQIIITKKKNSLSYGITLRSSGQEYIASGNWRLGVFYYGYGFISGNVVTDCHASYALTDIYKPVWVCGDSWVTYFESRWYYYAVENNHANFLKTGHSGEGSADGLIQLKTLLDINTPKCLLWLYGMNDADTDNNTPNTAWLTAFNEIKQICDEKGINLVVATIPTTPTRNNNAKNAIVRASGLRYVDEVMAMGADTNGNWITGYQSTDGNHTTSNGAKALYVQVLADAPEIALS